MHTRTITDKRGIVIHASRGHSLKPLCNPNDRGRYHFKLLTAGYNRYCEKCVALDLRARRDAGE